MPQKLLGLDVGSFSIKAALFDTTFRTFELTDLFESPPIAADELEPAERRAVTQEALLRLMSDNSLRPSTVVSALPGSQVSTRIITLPLPEKQVEKVLPFELEAQIPFEPEDILIDFHVIESLRSSTTVMAGAVRKAALAEHLALLRVAGLDPAFVGWDSLSLYNLNLLRAGGDEGAYAIVDLGHQKTSVCIVAGGKVKAVRTLFTAGRAVTDTLRERLNLTLPQAVEVKHNHGILELDTHPLKSPDLSKLSATIRTVMDPLMREIVQTFQSYRAQYAHSTGESKPVTSVFLSGGTSLLRNIPEYITKVTGLPCERLALFAPGASGAAQLGKREAVLGQAVALGLRAAARGAEAKRVARVNFRKGEFAFARDLSDLRQKAVFFSAWVAAIFVVLLAHVGIKYVNLSSGLDRTEQAAVRVYRRLVPDDKSPPKQSLTAVRKLEQRLSEFRSKQDMLTVGLNEMTALGVLREVSGLIPDDIPLDAKELSVERTKMTLRGDTDSFASVDRIIAALKEHPAFADITKGDTRDSASGKKAFMITINIGHTAVDREEEGP